MRLGLLSTANINQEILRGAAESDLVDVVAVGSRDGAKAQAYAAEHGIERAHSSYEALLGGRRRRRRLHLAPQRDAPRVDDARPRRGQARPLREAVLASRGGRRGGVRRRRRGGPRPDRGVHVPPPPAVGEGARARRGRRRRTAVRRQDDVLVPARGPVERSRAAGARRRRADGRRLLLHQRDPPRRGRPGARARRAGHGDDGDRHGVPRDAAVRRRRRRAVRGVVPLSEAPADGGRRGGRRAHRRGALADRLGRGRHGRPPCRRRAGHRGRDDPDRDRELVPAPARQPRRRDRGPRAAAPRSRRRARPGADDRGALPLGRESVASPTLGSGCRRGNAAQTGAGTAAYNHKPSQSIRESHESITRRLRERACPRRRRPGGRRDNADVQGHGRPRLHHRHGEEADEGREDQAHGVRQVGLPQLPPDRPRGQRQDLGRLPGNEDVHGHAEEGHVPVRVRPARDLHEGVVQGLASRRAPGRGSRCPARAPGASGDRDRRDLAVRRCARRRARRAAPSR